MTLLWIETTLEEIADIQTGSTPSKKNSQFYGGSFPLFKPGDLGSIYPLSYSDECLSDEGKAVARFIPANSTYVTCIGATIGKTGFVNVDATCNQQINTLTPLGGIVPKLVFYWMISPQMNHQIINGSSSTTMPIINKSRFSKLHCVLPPFAEQKVIADKLDTLLAQVETTKARLERIPEILKSFRQSVLAAAVSGKLTEEWRKENEVLIESWVSTNIGELAQVATGKTPKRTISEYWDDGDIPWLTSAATGDAITFEAEQFVTKLAVKECTLKLFPIGTLLLAMYGEGKTRGQVTELQLEATCNQACAAILVDETKVSKEFLKLRLQENYEETRKAAVGGAQPNLNLNKVREITVELPSEPEQIQIVCRVEELFVFADSIEQKATAALARVNNLTQSILAKAFRGELTAEWRAANPELISGDNSAAALLEKIKAERKTMKPVKKTRAKTAG
ncbi:restriction endonuclease subunit S [Shewanella algae]|uniref:restriction endonuclease subunit S n=1 Tax=Shewanella algae TaxID=38313 RepID=UPI0011B3D24B|nr:restriction endonuclease subunit S [Shewanella algae]TWU69653.1 restriction endonuclease subunit S [Shewanella algae]